MEQGWHPYEHWQGSALQGIALAAATAQQIIGPGKARRRLILSISSTSASVPSPVRFGFGQPSAVVGALQGAFELNSVQPWIILKYEDWGETLNQNWWAQSNLATEVYVSEILDSNPNCPCYGN